MLLEPPEHHLAKIPSNSATLHPHQPRSPANGETAAKLPPHSVTAHPRQPNSTADEKTATEKCLCYQYRSAGSNYHRPPTEEAQRLRRMRYRAANDRYNPFTRASIGGATKSEREEATQEASEGREEIQAKEAMEEAERAAKKAKKERADMKAVKKKAEERVWLEAELYSSGSHRRIQPQRR